MKRGGRFTAPAARGSELSSPVLSLLKGVDQSGMPAVVTKFGRLTDFSIFEEGAQFGRLHMRGTTQFFEYANRPYGSEYAAGANEDEMAAARVTKVPYEDGVPNQAYVRAWNSRLLRAAGSLGSPELVEAARDDKEARRTALSAVRRLIGVNTEGLKRAERSGLKSELMLGDDQLAFRIERQTYETDDGAMTVYIPFVAFPTGESKTRELSLPATAIFRDQNGETAIIANTSLDGFGFLGTIGVELIRAKNAIEYGTPDLEGLTFGAREGSIRDFGADLTGAKIYLDRIDLDYAFTGATGLEIWANQGQPRLDGKFSPVLKEVTVAIPEKQMTQLLGAVVTNPTVEIGRQDSMGSSRLKTPFGVLAVKPTTRAEFDRNTAYEVGIGGGSARVFAQIGCKLDAIVMGQVAGRAPVSADSLQGSRSIGERTL